MQSKQLVAWLQCIERTHGLPFKNALTGKTTTRYSPILLLQRGYLRNEIWAEHLWATALALALMEIPVTEQAHTASLLHLMAIILWMQILEMVDPEQGTGHGAEVLRLFRDMLVNKLDVEVLSAQVASVVNESSLFSMCWSVQFIRSTTQFRWG